MKQYLLSVYHPEDWVPEPDVMEQISKDVDTVNEEMQAAGETIPSASSFDQVMNNPDFSDGVAFLVAVKEPSPTA